MPGNHLSQDERSKFSKLKHEGHAMNDIARILGRHRSSLYREIKQRPGQGGSYCPALGHEDARAKRAAPRKKSKDTPEARAYLEAKLREERSPDAIGGRLKYEHREAQKGTPGVMAPPVDLGTTTIYKILERDKAEGGELYKLAPRRGRPYRKKRTTDGRSGPGKLPVKPEEELKQRPAMIETRFEPGHFELDLMFCGETVLLTGIDRVTRLPIIRALPSKESAAVAQVVLLLCLVYRIRSITFDRGLEWSGLPEVIRQLRLAGIKVNAYYCAPYHSWEKGAVECFNRQLRRWYPKGTNFPWTEQRVPEVAELERKLAHIPRKSLGYQTPAEVDAQWSDRRLREQWKRTMHPPMAVA